MKTTQEVKDFLEDALKRADEMIAELSEQDLNYKYAAKSGFYKSAIEQVIRMI